MQNFYQTFIWTCRYLFDFVVPRICAGCQKEHEVLCMNCALASYQAWANCLLCGARNMTGTFCEGNCRKQAPKALKNVYWAGKYDNTLKAAVSQLKYRRRRELAEPLGALIAKKFSRYYGHFDLNRFIIVPIPLHSDKQKERGFNQAELIAHSFGKEANIEILPGLLKKIIDTAPQAKTPNRTDRMENLKDAFVANNIFEDPSFLGAKTIVLVDDVSTTGATLFEASKALSRAGATHIIGIVVAHG